MYLFQCAFNINEQNWPKYDMDSDSDSDSKAITSTCMSVDNKKEKDCCKHNKVEIKSKRINTNPKLQD